jgi:hypothetical protein
VGQAGNSTDFAEVPPRHGGGTSVASNAPPQDSADWDGQEVPLPREIVQWLDQFVIGQAQAKKVRALAGSDRERPCQQSQQQLCTRRTDGALCRTRLCRFASRTARLRVGAAAHVYI